MHMNIDKLRKELDLRHKGYLDTNNYFSVLLPLIYIEDELHILFQVRSLQLNSQPGEICFPGGRIEAMELPLESAIRETIEELNLSENQIEVLGELDTLTTPFNTVLYSFCGLLKGISDIRDIQYNQQEVDSIFTVPVKTLLDFEPISYPLAIRFESGEDFPYSLIDNGKNYKWKTGTYPVYFFHYKEYVIWGLTAKILTHFLEILSASQNNKNNKK